MSKTLIVVFTYTLYIGLVESFSAGPPPETATCVNLVPATRAPHVLQSGSGTYVLTVNIPNSNSAQFLAYTAGTEYSGTISADAGINIRGFLVTAENPSGDRIGSFTAQTGQRFLDCSSVNSVPAAATLVHSTPNTASTVSFTWTAPSGADGMVRFRFTIVRSRTEYFGPIASASSSISATTMSTPMSSAMSPMPSTMSLMSSTMSPMSSTMDSMATVVNPGTSGSTSGDETGDSSTMPSREATTDEDRAGAYPLSPSIILGVLTVIISTLLL